MVVRRWEKGDTAAASVPLPLAGPLEPPPSRCPRRLDVHLLHSVGIPTDPSFTMELEDEDGSRSAIRALGLLFKLTEVFLWDEGSKEVGRRSSLPKHIVFKYDDDDDVNEDDSRDSGIDTNLDVHLSSDGKAHGDDGALQEEDMDLAQQMSALGLPLSFQTSKDKNTKTTKGKRRDSGNMRLSTQEKDKVLKSARLSEKENALGERFNDTQGTHLKDVAFEEHMLVESSPDSPSDNCTAVEDLASCITVEQSQSSAVAESSDAVFYEEDGSCYCTGSFGDWRAIWDSYYERNYFYNVSTHESTWSPPPGMEHLAFSSLPDESNAGIVKSGQDHVNSSAESEVIVKIAELECGVEGKLLDQLDHGAERLSSGLRVNAPCSIVVNANESQVLDGPEQILDSEDGMKQTCCNEMHGGEISCSEVNLAICDELLTTQVDEEGMDTLEDKVVNGDKTATPKRKKKAKKSRSRKKSLKIDQEQMFQCTVDSYYGGIGKYWCQRYLLFSKFDEGIKMDEEGWFSVTPEAIARHQASRCGNGVIVDCFTGVGGNAIQFATMCRHVIAVDIDPDKIEFAKHNAAMYGVDGQIDFVVGDSFSLAPKLEADTVFMSPPWGGPEYSKVETYDMDMLKPHDGKFLFNTFKDISSMIVMFLPRNVDLNQLAELCVSAGPLWSLEVERNFLNGKLKAVTAYFCKGSQM